MKHYLISIQKKRPWRHHLDVRRARARQLKKKLILLAGCMGAGACLFVSRRFYTRQMRLEFMRQEQEFKIQAVSQAEAAKTGMRDIQGIRFCPETLEIEFYHYQERVQSHSMQLFPGNLSGHSDRFAHLLCRRCENTIGL